MRRNGPAIAVLVAVLTLLAWFSAPAQAQTTERLTPYSGPNLRGKVFPCTANQNVAGGYWAEGSTSRIEQGSMGGRQTKATTWRVTLKTETAEVIRFSGASQTLEEPEVYSLEATPSGGLLLVWRNRPSGYSPQIMTIDPANSSFVYSTHHVNPMHNRASVFYGTCRPYS
jgi:hypothetical protein